MGKASSSKKVQRAARAAASSRGASERRELGFPLTVLAVVILGVVLVVAARGSREAKAEPRVGVDHWHSAYAIYDCETVLTPFQSEYDPDGIHSHQDGVIHIHPFNSGSAGEDATLSVFLEAMGATVSEDRITGPGLELDAGTDCNGEPTVIQVARFDANDVEAGPTDVYSEDFGSVRFVENLEAFTIARVPAGADIPPPPADRIAAASAASGELLSTGPETETDPSALADDPIAPETSDAGEDGADAETDAGGADSDADGGDGAES